MNSISCAIIEDDLITLSMIEGMAQKTPVLKVMGAFNSPVEAVEWLSDNHVDLLFLDIEMPDLNGLQLLQSLVYKPEVIVISGNPSFAVDAFEFSLADFILKPIKDYSRFLKAVNKVVDKRRSLSVEDDDTLYVRIDSHLVKINTDNINWIEASGDYVRIYVSDGISDGKFYTVYSTLKKICSTLPENKFTRVHRSFIVNLSKITNIDSNSLELRKKIIPISDTYKDHLFSNIRVL